VGEEDETLLEDAQYSCKEQKNKMQGEEKRTPIEMSRKRRVGGKKKKGAAGSLAK